MYKAISLSLKLFVEALLETNHRVYFMVSNKNLTLTFRADLHCIYGLPGVDTSMGINSASLDTRKLVKWMNKSELLTFAELLEMSEEDIEESLKETELHIRNELVECITPYLKEEKLDESKLIDWCLRYAKYEIEPQLTSYMNKLSETSLSLPRGYYYPYTVLLFTPIYEDDGLCYLKLTKETCENIVSQFGIFTLFLSLADVATSPNHFGQLIVNEVLTSGLAQLIK